MRTILRAVGFALLVLAGVVFLRQASEIARLHASQQTSDARYAELSARYDALLARVHAGDAELSRARDEAREVHALRRRVATLTRSQGQVSEHPGKAGSADSEAPGPTVSADQFTFAGYGSPENGFQSLMWASTHGEYGDWIAALGPGGQEKELANPDGAEEFRSGRTGPGQIRGVQVLARKRIGDGLVELKVRVDRENSSILLIFRMAAVGNEWKLGEDVRSYTDSWNWENVSTP